MPNDKLEKLKGILDLLQKDTIRPQELEQLLVMIIGVIKNTNENFKTRSAENLQEIKNTLAYVSLEHNQVLTEVDKKNNRLLLETKTQNERAYSNVQILMEEVRSLMPQDGKDADPSAVVPLVLEKIKLPQYKETVLDDGTQIIEKINELPTDDNNLKIDAKHIKNLPKTELRTVVTSQHYLAGNNITIEGNVISSTGGDSSLFVTVGFSNADYICDGVADNVQIQAAIDAIHSAGGGILFIKIGSYSLLDTVNLYSNITIYLDPDATLSIDVIDKSVFTATGTLGNELTNIHIIGNGAILTTSRGIVYQVNDVLTIAGGDGTATATVTAVTSIGLVKTVSISNGGSGYTNASAVHTTGGTNTGVKLNTTTLGVVSATTVHLIVGHNSIPPPVGGSGYSVGDVVTISGGDGTATAHVDTIGAAGTVTGLTVLTGGTGYTSSTVGATTTVAPPGGTGLLVDITVLGSISAATTSTGLNQTISFTYVNYSSIEGVKIARGQSACINFVSANYNTIKDCTIHDSTSHIISIKASSYNKITDNVLYNASDTPGSGQGIYLYDGSSNHNIISDNYLHNIVESGVRLEGSYNIVENNHIATCGRAGIYEAIYGTTRPIDGNIKNTHRGNYITDCNGQNNGHVHIWLQHKGSIAEGNNIYGTGTYDFTSDGIVVNAIKCIVRGNRIEGCSNAVLSEYPNTIISENNLQWNYRYGIWLSASLTGTNFGANVDHCSLVGNVIRNNGLLDRTYYGIRLSANGAATTTDFNILNGNVVYDDQDSFSTTISSTSNSGQKVLSITSIIPNQGTDSLHQEENFVAGMWLTITDGVLTETNQISSVDSATQLTMVNNLANTYTATGTVIGLKSQAYGIRFVTSTGGVNDRNIVTSNVCYGNLTANMLVTNDANIQIGNNITS